jgi:peroxiredoxin
MPDFALIDQRGRRVTLSQFRGRLVAVNFIYTSCALPQFCFRIATTSACCRSDSGTGWRRISCSSP